MSEVDHGFRGRRLGLVLEEDVDCRAVQAVVLPWQSIRTDENKNSRNNVYVLLRLIISTSIEARRGSDDSLPVIEPTRS